MPAPYTPGTGDIKSTHKPAALLEAAFLLQAVELSIPSETRPNNITITIDSEAGTATLTATLPITVVLDADGKPVVTAVDYIP